MAASSSKPDHTREGHDGWELVTVIVNAEERSPQYKDCNVSSSEKGTCTVGNELIKLDHSQPDAVQGIYVHPVKVQHSDFGESTTTGPTSSTLDNDHLHSASPTAPLEPPRPWTLASLKESNIAASKRDITAWVNGESDYWRTADDHASILPLNNGTTRRRSSDGSFDIIMPPLQPGDVVQDLLGAGGCFDGAVSYNTQLEVD